MSDSTGSDSFALRLGVVVDTVMRGQALTQAIKDEGFKVQELLLAGHCRIGDLNKASDAIDVWVIDVDFDQEGMDFLHEWSLELVQPVIVGEAIPYDTQAYQDWLRRVIAKLPQMAGQVRLIQSPVGIGRQIWVIAASTGGPEAVKQFFEKLPSRLDIAFIYVQHINPGFEHNLVSMLKSGNYRPFIATHGDVLQANSIAILSANQITEVLENGTLQVSNQPWQSTYAPSVDQVLANVARRFQGRCGAIIFSGMGNDGARGARLIAQRGGKLWVQSPESCAIPAMPQAVMAAADIDGQGTPESLAQQLGSIWQQLSITQAIGNHP